MNPQEKDKEIINFLNKYEDATKIITFGYYTEEGILPISIVNKSFANMERHDCIVDAIAINHKEFSDMFCHWGKNVFDISIKIPCDRKPIGSLWSAEIYISDKVPKDTFLLFDTKNGYVSRNIIFYNYITSGLNKCIIPQR